MALKVVGHTKPQAGNPYMQVVVSAPSRDELEGNAPLELAKQFCATRGFHTRSIVDANDNISPVDADGVASEAVVTGQVPIAGYIRSFKLHAGM